MLKDIQNTLVKNQSIVNDWVKNKFDILYWNNPVAKDHHLFPFYTSIDIRESRYKISPVDVNLFPAGFNNITLDNLQNNFLYRHLQLLNHQVQSVLLITEDFSRNSFYLKNIENLTKSLQYQFDTHVININAIENNISLLEKVDYIVLNTDLTIHPNPRLLQYNHKILPNILYGWFNRTKFGFFNHYNRLIDEITTYLRIDPWYLSTTFTMVNDIDFKAQIGINTLVYETEKLLTEIENKYHDCNIDEKPYVVIKPNNGTFGMGVMTIFDSQELLHTNKKTRASIHKIRDGLKNSNIFIQEGIPTDKTPIAENMIYNCCGNVIGFIQRQHENKNCYNSLNAPGMSFKILKNSDITPLENFVNTIVQLSVISEGIDMYCNDN